MTIAAVGDLLFHYSLEVEALRPGHTYAEFWVPVSAALAKADILYGNLEGTVADGIAFGGIPVTDPRRESINSVYGVTDRANNFNYHPSLLQDLALNGFKVVSTGNNHALDRGSIGVDRTIANLRHNNLAFTGTRASTDGPGDFGVVVRRNAMAVAFLSCTAFTNWPGDGVLRCYDQRAQVLSEIRNLAANPAIDAVVFAPHWGIEGDRQPDDLQRDLAQQAVESGALLVLGSHPHVLQPWQKLAMVDGREALVIYSNGNFISGMPGEEQRRGAIDLFELVKGEGATKARIAAAAYVPTWTIVSPAHSVIEDPRDPPPVLPKGNRIFLRDLSDWPPSCHPERAEAR
jgi:poly-gamma-glutamate synthesis protein (capsule biosynthesis protein)